MNGKITVIGERGIWIECTAEETSEYCLGEVVQINKTMEHWLETALSRIRAGEFEMAVLDDYGYVLKPECPDDCTRNRGLTCILEKGNFCIRRAGDYYKPEE